MLSSKITTLFLQWFTLQEVQRFKTMYQLVIMNRYIWIPVYDIVSMNLFAWIAMYVMIGINSYICLNPLHELLCMYSYRWLRQRCEWIHIYVYPWKNDATPPFLYKVHPGKLTRVQNYYFFNPEAQISAHRFRPKKIKVG